MILGKKRFTLPFRRPPIALGGVINKGMFDRNRENFPGMQKAGMDNRIIFHLKSKGYKLTKSGITLAYQGKRYAGFIEGETGLWAEIRRKYDHVSE
jgi:hypothetical protein